MSARGIEVPPARIVHSAFDAEGGRVGTTKLMLRNKPPTAIFVVNDVTAIGVMGALRDLGYEVGNDVAVVGYNDISITAELPVPLTSVHSPLTRMGAEAVRLLLRRLTGEPDAPTAESMEVSLSPRLIVRESSDPSARPSPPSRIRLTTSGQRGAALSTGRSGSARPVFRTL